MNPSFSQYGQMKTKKILIIINRIIAPDLLNLDPKFRCKEINLNSGPKIQDGLVVVCVNGKIKAKPVCGVSLSPARSKPDPFLRDQIRKEIRMQSK